MNTSNQHSKQTDLSTKSAGAGLFAAIIASLCCITPVFSLLAGISGIAATFSWVEPFRPYLIALTIGVLTFAWYQKLKPWTKEGIECACEEDEKPSFWQSKRFLGIVTVFAGLMLALPSYSQIFYPDSDSSSSVVDEQQSHVKQAAFKIKGMTCSGCESHVNNEVGKLEGVQEVKASYENENAVVKYDPEKVKEEQIVEAINKTGYKVVDKPNEN